MPDTLAAPTPAPWPEIDPALLDADRPPLPAFPLDVLPPAWRDWTADRARGLGAAVDHVAQGLLAAVAGVAGAGVEIKVTPDWSEPLVLWQALAGPASSGKSSVLDCLRDLLGAVESVIRESHGQGDTGALRLAVDDGSMPSLVAAVAANPRGVVLWHDQPRGWLTDIGSRPEDLALWHRAWSARSVLPAARGPGTDCRLDRFAVSILSTLEIDRPQTLDAAPPGLAARFLYAWPQVAPFCPFRDRRQSKANESVRMLLHLEEHTRAMTGRLLLTFAPPALDRLETGLAALHAQSAAGEGLEAAWLGKGPAHLVRLAAALALLAWSEGPAVQPPSVIEDADVEGALVLWRDYFRPHALAVLGHLPADEPDRRARRVVRWLRTASRQRVTGEDVRARALARTVNAAQAGTVLQRLEMAGIVRRRAAEQPARGRPPEEWEVNPALCSGR